MSQLIEPRLLQGFRDYAPAAMLPKERVLQTAREVYRSYGYAPIDTPALEFAEVLLGKGGGENDRLVYRFKDHGDRDVALRFDLTVPFARFSAVNVPQLGTPFKRYAMGPVWRGERPGQGRYREFWQCDFDTIGTTSNASDIEVALVINDLFTALGFEQFQVRVNNRLLLNGLLESIGVQHRSTDVLRAIDKLSKIGKERVVKEMVLLPGQQAEALFVTLYALSDTVQDAASEKQAVLMLLDEARKTISDDEITKLIGGPIETLAQGIRNSKDVSAAEGLLRTAFLDGTVGINQDAAELLIKFLSASQEPLALLKKIEEHTSGNTKVALGANNLRNLLGACRTAGVPDDRIIVDLSIARGLDYYTGTIYETFLTDLPEIGSVCSGGRYDNLASLYTKQVLPGVGASLGVDRLLAAMEQLKHPWMSGRTTPADVLVINFDSARVGDYQRVARTLRAAGIGVEVYPEVKKPKNQFEYADKRGFRAAVIAGSDEFARGVWKVKDLAKRQETEVSETDILKPIRAAIGPLA